MDPWFLKQNVHTLRGAEYRNLRQVLGSRVGLGNYQDDPRLLSHNRPWPQWTFNRETNQCVPCTWLPVGEQWRCDGFTNLLTCQARNGLPLSVDDVPRAYTCSCDFGCIECHRPHTNFSQVNACSEFPSQMQCGEGCACGPSRKRRFDACEGVPNFFQTHGVVENGTESWLGMPLL